MHNLDYSFPNYNAGGSQQEWEYDGEQGAYGASYEWEDEYETGEGEYDGEYEGYEGEYESYDGEMEDETALAAELLEITNEYELDQFLGKLWKGAKWLGRKTKAAAKKAGVYDIAKDYLKSAAKSALSMGAKAAGGFIGGPAGAAIAGSLADKGAQMLGLELEGLSPEDKEFEVARRFVQFANGTFDNVSREDSSLPDEVAARRAIFRAAQRYAPGLLAPAQEVERRDYSGSSGASGRWVRNGRNLIILNVF
ncbi:MAG TPA: hypothetical protein PK228_09130 [Saprospiraceae bacterium]|nr:hypothetical protein [Saprospiraceae bacterium]